MGTGRGAKKKEENLEREATAATNAWQATPFETEETARINKFRKQWDDGTDIGSMDYVKPYFNLYKSAINRDTDEQGVGVLGANGLSGASGAQAGLIGQQLKARREQDASGQLYDAANEAYADSTGQGNVMAQMTGSRLAGKAGLANQRYTSYLNRPKKPSIWETLLMKTIEGAGQAAGAYAGA
jgi:hypothetical protein